MRKTVSYLSSSFLSFFLSPQQAFSEHCVLEDLWPDLFECFISSLSMNRKEWNLIKSIGKRANK